MHLRTSCPDGYYGNRSAMSRITITICLLIPTIGCDELGIKRSTILDTGTDTEEPAEEFTVIDISPNYGAISGGTSVSILGNGFEGDVEVEFGNLPIDITVIDPETILFQTPSSPVETAVDVTVRSDLGEVTIENGFTYTNDAPDEDTDTQDTDVTDTGSGSTGSTGLTGGLVEMWRKVYACPSCFDPPVQQQTIEASVSIHTPIQGSWLSWLPPLNSCISVLNYPDLGNSINLGSVSITGNNTIINLNLDQAQGSYLNNMVAPTDYEYQTLYGLQTNDVSFGQILQTPSIIDSIEPSGLLDAQGFVQPFSKSNFGVWWGPNGSTDTILFLLEVYGQTGSYDTVTCLTTDSGGLGLDPTLLSNFVSGDLLIISLYRLQLTGAIHPDNGSTVEAVGAVGIIGTGYLVE